MPATKGWSRRFDEPIELPDGRKLRTLKEAIAWLAKEIPKSEHTLVCCDAASTVSGCCVPDARGGQSSACMRLLTISSIAAIF
jgi:hypothetical protein